MSGRRATTVFKVFGASFTEKMGFFKISFSAIYFTEIETHVMKKSVWKISRAQLILLSCQDNVQSSMVSFLIAL